ncbi:sugar ABC transporter substrate-binding protein [Rhodococcus jostii]|uniref:Substrate-binding domain-containing protein n=1 Tax=Rhodococcus jostii TaxID=132919 RepID=A0ABU4CTS9_RHOJO|nr:substrate-binding domain-containing protein [Rhodococcus jostii]MDV6286492.1 substrate-binding domain-containing protein [Rhodococcus jostii]
MQGKTLMYLSAGISSPSGTAGVAALEAVRDQLGFSLVTFDGQFTPSRYQDGMRQAVAQKVDALIVYGISCAGNESALREVHAAGIKIIGLQSVDCNEADPSAPAMFDTQPLYPLGDRTIRGGEVWAANGAAQADYLISQLEGNVKVIQFDVPDFAVTAALGRGFQERMAECSTCEIVESIDVAVADFGPGLQQKAEQALLKHPDANAVAINYDDLVTLGLSAAIQSSGRKDDLVTVAGTGYEATLDMIRQDNGLKAGWVQNHDWDHYAGIDTTLRLLSGQQPEVSGIPVILYDKDHNISESGGFTPATDFRPVFEQAWASR